MNERLNQEEIEVLLNEEAGKGAPAKEKASAPRAERRKETALPPAGDISAQVEARVPEDTTEKSGPAIEPAVFEEFSRHEESEIPVAGMEVLLDVPLAVSVELGRARCRVKDLLNLSVGSVVELDKAAGETVDVLVNGKIFAHGEVVVVDENFGVRVTDIVSKSAIDKGARKIS
ncbi:MAG: flagellar motor switch protein FliN [Bacillota bacterium]|jgi:flagellar motor switch protein FliN/FliY|nr:flagellar motor switch protein FliN [Candidatus Fermentithermobacillaceae bacterium]